MAGDVDIREPAEECTCTRLRRTARRVTQLYDDLLAPAGVTAAQFTILVFLSLSDGRSIGALADRADVDPTTLNRTLKPLIKRKLVRIGRDAQDGRVHAVFITDRGRSKVNAALPRWRQAQDRLDAVCGLEATRQLNDLLDLSFSRLGV